MGYVDLQPADDERLMHAVLHHPWHPSRHEHYPLLGRDAVWATLLCAERYRPLLPNEVWVMIFEFWTWGDF